MSYGGPDQAFIPGLELSAAFYVEAVEPILRRYFPGLAYAAARIGPGSDVLGFDDQRSAEHAFQRCDMSRWWTPTDFR